MTRSQPTDSIFPHFSLDRSLIHWEDYLHHLTPVECREGIWFKREDYFNVFGYGGPNGSKLRQLIWYMSTRRGGKTHVLSGASVRSPQLSMSAIVGAHYGLPTRLIVGASNPVTLLGHDNPRIATGFGAHFEHIKVAYNPALQREVARLTRPDSLVVEYGITVDHARNPAEDVFAFHDVGARQVANLPPEVTSLIMPAGSCNSLGSVLLGLSRDSKNLKTLFTLGIGPNKLPWVKERLALIGVDTEKLPFQWKHHSLHDTKFAQYSDMMPETFCGIDFAPTYEGKCIRWLKQNGGITPDNKTMFWIVGSAPRLSVVRPYFTSPTNNEGELL